MRDKRFFGLFFVIAAAPVTLLNPLVMSTSLIDEGYHDGGRNIAFAFAPSSSPAPVPGANSLQPVPPPPAATAPDVAREDDITTEASESVPDHTDSNNVNTTSLYENHEYGIQVRYPQNWFYVEGVEGEDDSRFDFGVSFMPAAYVSEALKEEQSGGSPEMPSGIGVFIGPLPDRNVDVQDFTNIPTDLFTDGLMSDGYEIISTNSTAILSGKPALEVLAEQPQDSIKGIFVMAFQDDKAYGVVYMSPESRFEQYLPMARDFMTSFTITKGSDARNCDLNLCDEIP